MAQQQLVVQGDIAIGMAMHAHSIRVMHGGGNGDGNGNTVGGDSGTAATSDLMVYPLSNSGCSWFSLVDRAIRTGERGVRQRRDHG